MIIFNLFVGWTDQQQSIFTIVGLPICTVGFNVVARLCVYRVLPHAREMTPWPLCLSTQGFLAVCSRLLISGLSSLERTAVSCLLVGAMELVSRSTVGARDWIGHVICNCRKPGPQVLKSEAALQFRTDNMIASMLSEYVAIITCNSMIAVTPPFSQTLTLDRSRNALRTRC